MEIRKIASHSLPDHSIPWLVSKSGLTASSPNVLLSGHIWWQWWQCCCCCRGFECLEILFLEPSEMKGKQV